MFESLFHPPEAAAADLSPRGRWTPFSARLGTRLGSKSVGQDGITIQRLNALSVDSGPGHRAQASLTSDLGSDSAAHFGGWSRQPFFVSTLYRPPQVPSPVERLWTSHHLNSPTVVPTAVRHAVLQPDVSPTRRRQRLPQRLRSCAASLRAMPPHHIELPWPAPPKTSVLMDDPTATTYVMDQHRQHILVSQGPSIVNKSGSIFQSLSPADARQLAQVSQLPTNGPDGVSVLLGSLIRRVHALRRRQGPIFGVTNFIIRRPVNISPRHTDDNAQMKKAENGASFRFWENVLTTQVANDGSNAEQIIQALARKAAKQKRKTATTVSKELETPSPTLGPPCDRPPSPTPTQPESPADAETTHPRLDSGVEDDITLASTTARSPRKTLLRSPETTRLIPTPQ
eukprot:Blabericola_migrator_1__11528@NODE_688_length_6867_cov_176_758529_g453_i1_p2_GENE_NODE_688_length_6867_cov_176_758529_g453_i1NODE_688_length_6867_cov_176_758529_g453_i1_p2_ORF_typecomplete_len399_score54_53_NODE_688_length_6867_cov_176_758529_g453_i156076803